MMPRGRCVGRSPTGHSNARLACTDGPAHAWSEPKTAQQVNQPADDSHDHEAVIPNSNPVFGIEVRGFDHIPDAERNMTLSEVGPLWLAANLNTLSIILGCAAISLGLNLWWALAACVVGNLPYAYLGLACIGTVRVGLPVTTLSRAVFGIRGNIFNAFCGWIASLAYEVIGTVFGVYALLALFDSLGWHGSGAVGKLLAVLIQLVFAGGVAMLGHATMIFLQRFAAWLLGAVLIVVLVYTCNEIDWTAAAVPHVPLAKQSMVATFMIACGVMASQPIGYLFNGPDWVRYLPRATPARQIFNRVFWWTFAPSIILTAMGAMWATLGDMSDPVSGLKPFIPQWLFVAYVVAVIGGSIASNVPVFYSSGLSLQSLGLEVKRWVATALDVAVSTSIALFILFVTDFTTALNNFVALLIVWVGPYGAVWMCDGYRRSWIYARGSVHRAVIETAQTDPDRRVAGWIALFAGMVVGASTMRSPLYDGPLAMTFGGSDLNWILGFAASGIIYLALTTARSHTS